MSLIESGKTQEQLIGASCFEVIDRILDVNPSVRTMWFKRYPMSLEPTTERIHHAQEKIPIAVDEDFWHNVVGLAENLGSDENLALTSKVELIDGSKHVPMIDFALPISPENPALIRRRMGLMMNEQRGFLLNSGNSYHFYGLDLLGVRDLPGFLGRCILMNFREGEHEPLTEVADARYVGHRLIDGVMSLRLTANGDKKYMPSVVSTI